jgi:hypothetical protein
MIKFFRKIRQNLLSENKFSKYLLYAVGEIVLVIIGILIALAINQKNTDKNNNELRDLYLIQLNEEINENLKTIINHRDKAITMLTELDTLVGILKNKEYNNPKLLLKSRFLYRIIRFNPATTTYENLKFSGDLKLFRDLKLRNSISKAYDTFNDIKIWEENDIKYVDNYGQGYLVSNARLMNLSLSNDNYGKDLYFENVVVSRRSNLRILKNRYEESMESLDSLKTIFAVLQNSK